MKEVVFQEGGDPKDMRSDYNRVDINTNSRDFMRERDNKEFRDNNQDMRNYKDNNTNQFIQRPIGITGSQKTLKSK